MKRVLALLRSRRLAALLLVAFTTYVWLTTLIPQVATEPAAVALWDQARPLLAVPVNAVGLHAAYTSPVFLLMTVLLMASTIACAWERTASAAKLWRTRGLATRSTLARLRLAPNARLETTISDETLALDVAARALRGSGMRVRRGPVLLEAVQGRFGILGSPLFHWALAMIFLFAAAGQLTRHEGIVSILQGETVLDAAESYEDTVAGPLFGNRFTDQYLSVQEIDTDFSSDRISRGGTPYVVVLSGDSTVAEGWVYPNHPLSTGSMLIHRVSVDPALVGTLEFTESSTTERVVLHYDFDVVQPQEFSFTGPGVEATRTVSVAPVEGERVAVTVQGDNAVQEEAVGVGQSVQVAPGVTFTVDELTYFADLSVVHDWSVPWVFAGFYLGIIGFALTVFVPYRVVHVMCVRADSDNQVDLEQDGLLTMHVVVRSPKSDPAFPRRAVDALREALSGHQDGHPIEGQTNERSS